LIEDEIRRNFAGFEGIEERGLDQKRKISHTGLHCCFFICFFLSAQKQNDAIPLLDITHVLLSFSNKTTSCNPWS
jgi:hypothetical protein